MLLRISSEASWREINGESTSRNKRICSDLRPRVEVRNLGTAWWRKKGTDERICNGYISFYVVKSGACVHAHLWTGRARAVLFLYFVLRWSHLVRSSFKSVLVPILSILLKSAPILLVSLVKSSGFLKRLMQVSTWGAHVVQQMTDSKVRTRINPMNIGIRLYS